VISNGGAISISTYGISGFSIYEIAELKIAYENALSTLRTKISQSSPGGDSGYHVAFPAVETAG
jgi:hypothetical protein